MLSLAALAPVQAQTVLYTENFDNGNTTVASPTMIAVNPSGYATYTGPAPVSMTYTADPMWVTNCNGWVGAWNSPIADPRPLSATHCNPDPFVAQIMWNRATQNSEALGAYVNNVAMGTAVARNNLAMTAYTSGAEEPGTVQTLIMQNATPIAFPALPTGGTGRFVTFSIVASSHCGGPGLIRFYILNPGETQLGTGDTNLCTGGVNPQTYIGSAHGNIAETLTARVATFVPTGAGAAVLVNGTGMTFRIRNRQPSGSTGNDWGWDNFKVLDVSPSISKAATPAASYVGQAKTLTFTITNTALDNAAKVGWGFTDTLPANVTVAPTPNPTTTCAAGTTINAIAGAGTIAVSAGNLPAGTPDGTATTCTVSVDVISTVVGVYTNGPANFTASTGLNLPAANINMEWVRNRLTVTKISNDVTSTFSFTNGNDADASTLPYTITTAAAGGTGTAGPVRILTAGSTTADTIITETPSAGWQLTAATCTGLAAGQSATRNGNVVTLPFAGLAAVTGGRDIACTLTNARQTTTLQLAKAWAAASIAGHQVSIGATTGGTNNTAAFNATAPTAANSGAAVTVTVGNEITLPAETGTNVGNYTTALACTGDHTLSGTNGQQANTLTITGTNAAVCTYTNTLVQADLSITKTNTPADGALDQANDTVTSGAATTYSLVVSNNGPSTVTGAVVRDTPTAELTCPPGNPVTITGDGVPAGSFTVANLTGATGIILGTLTTGQRTTLSFNCDVN